MFCVKCGNELKNGAKFCPKCGTSVIDTTGNDDEKTEIITSENSTVTSSSYFEQPVENLVSISNDSEMLEVPVISQKTKRGKTGIKIFSIIALLIIVLGLVGALVYMFFFSDREKKNAQNFDGQLRKAEELMDADDYEGAIGYYKAALEENPDSVDVYEGLARAYIQKNRYDQAIKILETGYEVTQKESLRELLVEVQVEKDGNKQGKEKQETEEEGEQIYTGEKTDINIEVRQVDNSKFPEVTLYTSITDNGGNTIENLTKSDFDIKEIDSNGDVVNVSIDDVYQVLNEDKISLNLVLDASSSMDSYNKMQQAKNAANALVDYMELTKGDQIEVISFDDFVYLEQDFSSQKDIVQNAINGIGTNGSTALYDALYAGLFQTYYEEGAKCVIGFTDGMENASSYTFDDVVAMAQGTGIPVFIIGIGEEYDADELQKLANQCSGKYYSANVNDLETILEDIYISIYREQQDYYVFKYRTTNQDNLAEFRDVVLETSNTTEFSGSYRKAYVPQTDITGAFSATYMNQDYILDYSDKRTITEPDLAGLSLAELRIARNEIFARHGRQFKDNMLNQWFYSKTWYLNIPSKYSPNDFDAMRPSPLSKLEIDNANFIKQYEDSIMSNQDIFPDASNVKLSDYDLALSKAVLRNALNQMQLYQDTSILEENIRLVQEAINKEDIQY